MQIKPTLEKWSKNKTIVIVTLIFVYPLGVYLMWKGQQFNRDLRWFITGILIIWTMILNYTNQNDTESSSCSETYYANGCTYYRDSSCSVIAKSCE